MNEEVDILLVEDSPTDADLTRRALARGEILSRLHHVIDGVDAMQFLKREGEHRNAVRPDLILLDLNMPRMNGREVLSRVKQDSNLRNIPIVVLTTSNQERDVLDSYGLSANAYIFKPVEWSSFLDVVKRLSDFWLKIVRLPNKP